MITTISYKDDAHLKSASHLIPHEDYKTILDNVPIVCVDLVIVQHGQVCLVKRKNDPAAGVYWFQGGRLNKNETFQQCGIRKAALELDIPEHSIRIVKYLGTFSTMFSSSAQGGTSHTVNITYQAKLDGGVVPKFDADHSDARWFAIDGRIPGELQSVYTHHPYVLDVMALIDSTL